MLNLIIFFSIGIALGYFFNPLSGFDLSVFILLIINILLFLVGFTAGGNREIFSQIKQKKARMLLVPVASLLGSIGGGILVASFFTDINYFHASLISASMGYYSLPSILVSSKLGIHLGALLFLANIMREVFVLLLTPVIARLFGRIAPIAAGGATTMDVTLPIIIKSSGSDYVITSVINGTILTVSVPIIINLLLLLIK